jgi:hypothetical protein
MAFWFAIILRIYYVELGKVRKKEEPKRLNI